MESKGSFKMSDDVRELEEEIKRNASVVVIVGAISCSCTGILLNFIFFNLLGEYSDIAFRYSFEEMGKSNSEIREKFGITEYPTVLTFFNGVEVSRRHMPESKEKDIVEMLEELAKRNS